MSSLARKGRPSVAVNFALNGNLASPHATRHTGATIGVAAMGAFVGMGAATESAYALILSALICAAADA